MHDKGGPPTKVRPVTATQAIGGPRMDPTLPAPPDIRVSIAAELRRRADAAILMPPLPGRAGVGLAARDGALDWPPGVGGPATFGLDQAELRAEVRRKWDAGWQRWELRRTFDLPGLDAWAA